MSQLGSSSTECKALGTISLEALQDLIELLKGLSGDLTGQEVKEHQVLLRMPSTSTEVRLLHSLLPQKPDAPARLNSWVVQHLVTNTRGNIRDLLAIVQAVTEAKCQGPDVLGFWKGLSFQQAYESIREGVHFRIPMGELEVNVGVVRLFRMQQEGDLTSTLELFPDARLVEATCRVANGAHIAGAKCIGELAAMLKPLVELQKA